MPFPTKLETLEGLIEAGSALGGRVRPELRTELRQVPVLRHTLVWSDLNSDVSDAARRLDQRRGTAVKLLVELLARWVDVEEVIAWHGRQLGGRRVPGSTA